MDKKGIAIAGNMIVDILYPIDGFPGPGELTAITGPMLRSTGGCLCNVITDLAALDGDLPLTALGHLGCDKDGDFIQEKLQAWKNIDLSQIRRSGTTSYTLVMADERSKQRSFYHCHGGNADFCEADINWDMLDISLLHIGYILLLDALDAPDDLYGTKLARLLAHAQKRGIRTSVDVVTKAGTRLRQIVPPALKYTDYCVINEAEAQAVTGIRLMGEGGKLIKANLPAALRKMKELGVSAWAVIHSPEGGFGLDEQDDYVEVPALQLPEGYIKGSVGAGDAFCSGVLYGVWKGMSFQDSMELGTAAAACSLSQPGATEGMRGYGDTMRLYRMLRGNQA